MEEQEEAFYKESLVIAFYRGRSLVSWLIQRFTWGPISHVAIWEPLTNMVYEAWHRGGVVRRHSFDEGHTPGTHVELYAVRDMSHSVALEVFHYLDTQVGKKYDFRGIWGFMVRRRRQNPDKWFCSELVMEALRKVKIFPLDRIWPHQVSPSALRTSPKFVYLGEYVTGKGFRVSTPFVASRYTEEKEEATDGTT